MSPEFKKALEDGLVEPATLNGTQIVIDDMPFYQVAAHGTKMMMQRFNQYSDAMQKHERLRLTDSVLRTALATLLDTTAEQFRTISEAFRSGQFDGDSFQQWMTLYDEQKRIISRLNERVDIGFDLYQSYEIAAIWFLTEDEDPAYTTAAKIRQKVQAMMSRPDLYAFFLSLPLTNFNPLSLLFEPTTLSLAYNQTLLENMDLKTQLMRSQQLGLSNETTSFIQSRAEELRTSLDLIEQLSIITTDSYPQ